MATNAPPRSGTVSRYRSWLACCLSRGADAPLSEADIERLAAEIGERSVAGGMPVFRRGDPAAQVHIIRHGAVELSRRVGGRRVTLQTLGPGDVFGDVPAFLHEPEPFDALALEDSSVLSIEAEALVALLLTRPAVARRWFVSLSERMAGLQDRLVDLLAGPLQSQLSSLLLRTADDRGVARVTQANLADMLGVQRSSVQRVLKSLEAAGLVELHYRRVLLVDRVGLAEMLADGESP